MPRKASTKRNSPPKVALLIETSNAYARGLLRGIEDYILAHGPWNVYLGEQGRGDTPPEWLATWDGDGVIARIENEAIARPLAKLKVPIVDMSAPRLIARSPTVTPDNVAIARLAVQHFTERGFRHFAYCGEDRFVWSIQRGEAFSLFVRSSGYECSIYEQPKPQTNNETEIDRIGKWLRTLPKPVAIFCSYDAHGQRVLNACRRVGLAVPEEVAVLGVDNDELLCALSPPPLSSIALNTQRGGWEAAAMLAVMMKGGKVAPDIHRVAPLNVVTRLSTDILAVDDPPLSHALRYIREHACEGIGISDVLQHCPMARRNFEMRLKALLGRTPREEITRVQIQRVKDLLIGTKLSLGEIADRTGFKHVEYMTVVFKRECGQPPSTFRAGGKGQG